MKNLSGDDVRAERAAGKVTDAKNLPRLRSRRQSLEREVGALAVATQRQLVLVLGVCGALAGAYAIWTTLSEPLE